MTFEQEIKAIDDLAQSFRSREQVNIILTDEVVALKEERASLAATLESLTAVSKRDEEDLNNLRVKYETEVRNNGELKATLKQLLAEQMALASRAAEMLRSLETPPEMITPKTIEIVKPTFASEMNDAHKKDQEERLLELHVQATLADIAKVPKGEIFILDAPYGERITDWVLKKWYRRILGKAPGNYQHAPSIELYKKENGAWTFLRQAPKLTNTLAREDREPIPFRTEEAKSTGNGETPNPFVNNGEEIPGFLNKGPKSDADYEREGRA